MELVDQREIIVVEPIDEVHARALLEKKLGRQDKRTDIPQLAAALEFVPLAMVRERAIGSDHPQSQLGLLLFFLPDF